MSQYANFNNRSMALYGRMRHYVKHLDVDVEDATTSLTGATTLSSMAHLYCPTHVQ